MNVPIGEVPKRGDLLQSNRGSKRERTWFIIAAHLLWMRSKSGEDRFKVWRARWWELEADMRMKLYRSAERAGGQVVWFPYPKQFENLRRRSQP